jgi:hypothetical protein
MPFIPRKNTGSHLTVGWVGPKTGLGVLKKKTKTLLTLPGLEPGVYSS